MIEQKKTTVWDLALLELFSTYASRMMSKFDVTCKKRILRNISTYMYIHVEILSTEDCDLKRMRGKRQRIFVATTSNDFFFVEPGPPATPPRRPKSPDINKIIFKKNSPIKSIGRFLKKWIAQSRSRNVIQVQRFFFRNGQLFSVISRFVCKAFRLNSFRSHWYPWAKTSDLVFATFFTFILLSLL